MGGCQIKPEGVKAAMYYRGEDSQVMKVENHLMGMEENKFHPGLVTALCA